MHFRFYSQTSLSGILLKWITSLNGYQLSGLFRYNLKYKTWISGYSTSVDTHNQVPELSTCGVDYT